MCINEYTVIATWLIGAYLRMVNVEREMFDMPRAGHTWDGKLSSLVMIPPLHLSAHNRPQPPPVAPIAERTIPKAHEKLVIQHPLPTVPPTRNTSWLPSWTTIAALLLLALLILFIVKVIRHLYKAVIESRFYARQLEKRILSQDSQGIRLFEEGERVKSLEADVRHCRQQLEELKKKAKDTVADVDRVIQERADLRDKEASRPLYVSRDIGTQTAHTITVPESVTAIDQRGNRPTNNLHSDWTDVFTTRGALFSKHPQPIIDLFVRLSDGRIAQSLLEHDYPAVQERSVERERPARHGDTVEDLKCDDGCETAEDGEAGIIESAEPSRKVSQHVSFYESLPSSSHASPASCPPPEQLEDRSQTPIVNIPGAIKGEDGSEGSDNEAIEATTPQAGTGRRKIRRRNRARHKAKIQSERTQAGPIQEPRQE